MNDGKKPQRGRVVTLQGTQRCSVTPRLWNLKVVEEPVLQSVPLALQALTSLHQDSGLINTDSLFA